MKTLKEYITEGILDIEDNIENLTKKALIEGILNDIKSNPKNKGFYRFNKKNREDLLNTCYLLGFKKAKSWKDMNGENCIVFYTEDVSYFHIYKFKDDFKHVYYSDWMISYPKDSKLKPENVVYKTPSKFKKLFDVFIIPDDIANMLINIYE